MMTREKATIQSLMGHIEALEEMIKTSEQQAYEDTISRQAAIDAFEKFIHELGIEDEPYNYGEMALSVQNVPPVTLQQTSWIPVNERLPKEKGLYLVSVKNEHDRRYSKTCWFHGNGNWFTRQDVIAWMPLPKPYKAESEE